MSQLIDTVRNYDPDYKRKVKQVVEVIENELSQQKQFSAADVGRHVDLDCGRYLRLLSRCGFLTAVKGGTAWKDEIRALK